MLSGRKLLGIFALAVATQSMWEQTHQVTSDASGLQHSYHSLSSEDAARMKNDFAESERGHMATDATLQIGAIVAGIWLLKSKPSYQ